jgi:hypothetical protein
MQKAPFHRKSNFFIIVVRQIIKELNFETDFRFQSGALLALQ